MTDDEFNASMTASGMKLRPETLADLRAAAPLFEAMLERVRRPKGVDVEPAIIFYPEQRA